MGLFKKGWNYSNDATGDENGGAGSTMISLDTSRFEPHPITDKGEGTTVVFLPFKDSDGTVHPERETALPDSFTPWLFRHDGVRFAGLSRKVTMFFDYPEKNFSPYRDHPYFLLRSVCYDAQKQEIHTPFGSSRDHDWPSLVWKDKAKAPPAQENGNKAKFEGVALGKVQKIYVGLGLVYAHKKEMYWGAGKFAKGARDGDPLRIIVMSQNAAQALTKQLNLTKDDVIPSEDDFSSLRNYPVVGQKFVTFHSKNSVPNVVSNMNRARGAIGAAANANAGAGDGFGYAVAISNTVDGMKDSPTVDKKEIDRIVRTKCAPWDEVIFGHDIEKVAEEFGNNLGIPHSVLYHAWREHKEWYPADLRKALDNPVSNTRVAAPQQTGWYGSNNSEDDENGSDVPVNDPTPDDDDSGAVEVTEDADEDVIDQAVMARVQAEKEAQDKLAKARSALGSNAATQRATAARPKK